jgi:hypothetical protein
MQLAMRNRMALALSNAFGIGPAADFANRWTRLRQRLTPRTPAAS